MFHMVAIKEMQIKTSGRFHYTPTWMAQTERNLTTPGAAEDTKGWNSDALLGEMPNGTRGKTVWQFLKALNIQVPRDPAIPLLGIYPREMETCVCTKTCTPVTTAALQNHQGLETTPKSFNQQTAKHTVGRHIRGSLLYFVFFIWGHVTRHAGSQFPDQESNLCPLKWKLGVLTTGPPENSL